MLGQELATDAEAVGSIYKLLAIWTRLCGSYLTI